MKQNFVSTIVLLFSLITIVQSQDDVVKNIKSGFKNGNAKEIAIYFNNKTELAFEGEKRVYDKVRAEQMLSSFLSENKPKDFQILHQGASKDGLKFYIGELISSHGTHRILVYLRNDNGKSFVETIDISKE